MSKEIVNTTAGRSPESIVPLEGPPLLEQLGFSDLGVADGKVELSFSLYQSAEPEPDANYLFCPLMAESNFANGSPGRKFFVSGLWQETEAGKVPVGHLSLHVHPDWPQEAFGRYYPYDYLGKKYPWPDKFRRLFENFWRDNRIAFGIDKEFQGRRLGSLLWALELSVLELRGVKSCIIAKADDYTDTRKAGRLRRRDLIKAGLKKSGDDFPLGSFYSRWGAQETTYTNGFGIPVLAWEAPTRLSSEQEMLIRELRGSKIVVDDSC